MGFTNYKGSLRLGAGLTPASEGYPLMQSCDIQVDEDGTRLDEKLAALREFIPIILTQEEYDALVEGGTITLNGQEISYEENRIYLIKRVVAADEEG